jgi:Kdo2-lipid IVA lauroyltransferase/acyltransferase
MIIFKLISFLPQWVLYIFSDLLFLIGYYVIGYRKKVILENLQHAFPEKSENERREIARLFFRNLTDSFAEIIKMYSISKEELDKRVKIKNKEIVLDVIENNQVIIGLTGHFFNWEMHLLQMMANVSNKCDVVYLKVNNPFFEKLMLAIRTRFGGGLIERSSFQRDYLRKRDQPRLIVLAADQRPSHGEIRYWAPFMNRETAFFEGAEKLAKRFNHPVMYSHVHKPKRGHYTFTYEMISVPPYENEKEHSITDAYIALTEKNIREQPSLYLWSHKRWKDSR